MQRNHEVGIAGSNACNPVVTANRQFVANPSECDADAEQDRRSIADVPAATAQSG
jgi:hypothetical protein